MLRGAGNIDQIVIKRHKDLSGNDGWMVHVWQGDQAVLVPPFYERGNVDGLVGFIREVLEAHHGQSKEVLTERKDLKIFVTDQTERGPAEGSIER